MVLYGPRLMSSACSWLQGCKLGKAQGRKAISALLRKSNLLGGLFCTCVNNKFDPGNYLCHFCTEWWNLWGGDFLNLKWPWLLCFLGKASLSLAKWASSLPASQNEVKIGTDGQMSKPNSLLVPLLVGVGFPCQSVRQLQELMQSP